MASSKNRVWLLLLLLLVLHGVASASPPHPARLVSGLATAAASKLLKRIWALKPSARAASGGGGARSAVKFEGGYTVETVFDGSKLGIEPYAVEVTPAGELLVLDSVNSNVYRVGLPLSRYSRPRLVAGSPEGYAGHVDGRLREARLHHPKGITMDDRGNIYVADAMNMAIRRISDTGVTTIAGGKSGRGGHVDGPSDDAKFSTDFEVRYVGSSCSLLVIDRGNQAIREIQLRFEDCAYQYETGFPLGVALLLAAAFFGYMLALLQRRVTGMVSVCDEVETAPLRPPTVVPPYQKPLMKSVRPPLIPTHPEQDKLDDDDEEGLFAPIGKLFSGIKSSFSGILAATFSNSKRKKSAAAATMANPFHHRQPLPQQRGTNPWPVQESYSIPADEPPPLDTRTPTPHKNYAFMSKEPEKIHHVRHTRHQFSGWEAPVIQQPPPQQHQVYHLQQHRQHSAGPKTVYEQSCEATNEIVFGAVQELDTKRRAVEIKAVNYNGDAYYEQQYGSLRYRVNGGGGGY